jgi:hypothetical protein
MKLEWGNPTHIKLVRNFDEIMSGTKPVLLRYGPSYCTAKQSHRPDGVWLFQRVSHVTKNIWAVADCPKCNKYVEVVFSTKYIDTDWHSCKKCGIDFVLKQVKLEGYPWERFEVFVQQEGGKV